MHVPINMGAFTQHSVPTFRYNLIMNSAITYCSYRMEITPRSRLEAEFREMPLTSRDIELLHRLMDGMQYKELADLYGMSMNGVYQWKRRVMETMRSWWFYNGEEADELDAG